MEKWPMVKRLPLTFLGRSWILGGVLTPFIAGFLKAKGSERLLSAFGSSGGTAADRNNIRTYHDAGPQGYLETARRAFVYALGLNGVAASRDEVREFMKPGRNFPFSGCDSRSSASEGALPIGGAFQRGTPLSRSPGKERVQWQNRRVISVQVCRGF